MSTALAVTESTVDNVIQNFLNDDSSQYKKELLDIGNLARTEFNNNSLLMKTKLGELLQNDDGAFIEKNLVKMNVTLSKINPAGNVQITIIRKIFGEGNSTKRLAKIVSKYNSAEKTIEIISEALHKGQTTLWNNNKELQHLEKALKDQAGFVECNIQLLQTAVNALQKKVISQPDNKEIDLMLNNLLIKLQDFKIMQEVTAQSIISIQISYCNNELLSQSVDRVCDITLQLMYSSLSIKAALENQKKVLEAVKSTKEFASNLLLQNAETLEKTVEQTNSIYSDPLLDIDKLKEAHKKLVGIIENSIDITGKNRTKLLSTIKELNEMPELRLINTKLLPTTDKIPKPKA